jgi:hypothetical protein
LFEPHHNTYDIEFWGPDGMCTSIYCAALAAMSAMARHLGEEADARDYGALAQRSAAYLAKELFNGEYFAQKVMWNELQASGIFKEMLGKLKPGEHDLAAILKAEGPRYQYGSGCISDGVIGAWMAQAYGVETPQDRKLIRKHLKSIFRYNFREDLFRHACPQRPGYAMGHDGGLILSTWPKGGKPTLPFIYSDEVWTGIEYQVASHMIAEGLDGKVPEIEQKLDYKFSLVLCYVGLDDGFPSVFMNRSYQEGRIVELTLQATESVNTALFDRSPWLELYKSGDDARLRAFARAAKEFGKPFLLRLNNEMNSDWVSYGGVTNLLDPDIFIENWRTVYRIFEEEGVNNAIWIFNPNDGDYPPNAWNCKAAYYPAQVRNRAKRHCAED